jgi:hypothetical protein
MMDVDDVIICFKLQNDLGYFLQNPRQGKSSKFWKEPGFYSKTIATLKNPGGIDCSAGPLGLRQAEPAA